MSAMQVQDYATLDVYEREDGDILMTSTWNVGAFFVCAPCPRPSRIDHREEGYSCSRGRGAWWPLQVEWRDAEDPAERSREILGASVVKTMLTNRFTDAAWFAPSIKHLQEVLFFPLAHAFAGNMRLAPISRSTSGSQETAP